MTPHEKIDEVEYALFSPLSPLVGYLLTVGELHVRGTEESVFKRKTAKQILL